MSRRGRPGRFSPIASRVALGLGCIAVLAFPVSWERLPNFRPVPVRQTDPRRPFPGIDPTADPRSQDPIVPTTSTTTTTTTFPGQAPPTTTTTTTPPYGSFKYFAEFGDKPPYISTCKPIEFVIRKEGGPSNGDQLVLEAVQRLSNVTGVQFKWNGFTDAKWNWNDRRSLFPWEARREPLWIGWLTDAEAPDAWGGGNETTSRILGRGGPGIIVDGPNGQKEIIGGHVALRSGALLPQTFGPGPTLGNVILHELAHAFGLDHVQDPTQQMNPAVTNQAPDGYAAGDIRGLQGITKGCN